MNSRGILTAAAAALLLFAASWAAYAENQAPSAGERGIASWYAGEFDGRLTANGEVFDAAAVSAAHRTLPFGTVVRVTNERNGLSLDVRINDRGPFVEGRIIDLSRGAAEALGMVHDGLAPVTLEIIYLPEVPESAYLRPGDTAWTEIQVGAYRSAELVLERYFTLNKAGFAAHILRGENGFYRLLVDAVPYDRQEQVRAELAGLGFTQVLVFHTPPPAF
jgi:rare lipoprotein A